MYDLSYRGEHLAWQQRLVKEERTYSRPATRSQNHLGYMASNPNSMVNEPYISTPRHSFQPNFSAEAYEPPRKVAKIRVRKRQWKGGTVSGRTASSTGMFPSYPKPLGETATRKDWKADMRVGLELAHRKIEEKLIERMQRLLQQERKVILI